MIDFGCQGRIGRGVGISPFSRFVRVSAGRGVGRNSVGASSQSGNSSLELVAHEPLYAVARRPRIGRRCQVWGRTRPESGPRSALALSLCRPEPAPAVRSPRLGRIRRATNMGDLSFFHVGPEAEGFRLSAAQPRTGDRLAVRSAPPGPRRKGPILIAPGMVPSLDVEVQRRYSQAKRQQRFPPTHETSPELKAVASTGLALAHPPVSFPPTHTPQLNFHTPLPRPRVLSTIQDRELASPRTIHTEWPPSLP